MRHVSNTVVAIHMFTKVNSEHQDNKYIGQYQPRVAT